MSVDIDTACIMDCASLLAYHCVLWKCNNTNLRYNNNLDAARYANRKYESDAACQVVTAREYIAAGAFASS